MLAAPSRFRIGGAIAGHLIGLALALALAFASLAQLRTNTSHLELLIDREAADVVRFQRLAYLSERTGRTGQKFLLTGRPELADEMRATRKEMAETLAALTAQAESVPTRTAMAEVARLAESYYARLEDAIEHALGPIASSTPLLVFARSGRSAGDRHTGASVKAAIFGALDSLTNLREEVGAEVETDVEDASVACAPALLLAVTTNLLSNALKFLDGRAVRRVRVVARSCSNTCQFSVEDTGPGIAPEHQRRLFEPFYRTPGVRAPGSGLGLAPVHRIVEAAGGSIAVTSRVEVGTRFTVTLPSVGPNPNPTPDPIGVELEREAGLRVGLPPS